MLHWYTSLTELHPPHGNSAIHGGCFIDIQSRKKTQACNPVVLRLSDKYRRRRTQCGIPHFHPPALAAKVPPHGARWAYKMVVHRSGSLLPVAPARSEPAVTVASIDLLTEARRSAPDTGDVFDLEELAMLDTRAEVAQQLSPAVYLGFKQAEEPRPSFSSGLNPHVRSSKTRSKSITPNVSLDDSSCSSPSPPGFDEPSTSGYAADLDGDVLDPFGHESAAAAAARAHRAAAAARATYRRVLGSQFIWLQTSLALSTLQAR